MRKEKRRPTLNELKLLPIDLWQLEAAQIAADACLAKMFDIEIEATTLMGDSDLTPEKIVALREKLRCATGSTVVEKVAAAPSPAA
jgi:hypothetical protein